MVLGSKLQSLCALVAMKAMRTLGWRDPDDHSLGAAVSLAQPAPQLAES
jgi:hypothetical protein